MRNCVEGRALGDKVKCLDDLILDGSLSVSPMLLSAIHRRPARTDTRSIPQESAREHGAHHDAWPLLLRTRQPTRLW